MISQPEHDQDPRVLAGRLNAGWALSERESDPDRQARLERHWLTLLRRYEAVCDGVDQRSEQKADDRFGVEVRHGD